MKIRHGTFAAFLVMASASGAQVLPVKPGLWEHRFQLTSESGRLELALELARTHLALLPPAQRRMLDELMARPGVTFDLQNQRFLTCVSEQEAATGNFRFAEGAGCDLTVGRSTGEATDISFTCLDGQGNLTLKNGTEYTGNSSMTIDFGGFIERATAVHDGRWLGGSCPSTDQAR